MTRHNIKLSAFLTTHIPKADLFNILHSLLRMEASDIEIIIIDDAAPQEISKELQSTIESHNNDMVFLLEHEMKAGRGVSLNEALVQATGKFIWTPVRADRFNVNLFRQALNRFSSDPAAIWVMDYDLPANVMSWLDEAEKGNLPDDGCFLWNRSVLKGEEFFFNPFLTHLHGSELAMRVHGNHVWHRTDPFFVIGGNQYLSPAGSNLEEFFRTAHRVGLNDTEKQEVVKRLINTDFTPNTDADDADLLTQSRQLLAQDNSSYALELINAFLKKKPKHAEALQIKISALEKQRRHVEAAEFKHDLRHIIKDGADRDAQKRDTQPESSQEANKEPVRQSPEESITGGDEHKGIRFSIVVPTTGLGKIDLERCLTSLENVAASSSTELIVIDNASIDDTFDYLEQLQQDNFLQIRVITNSANEGFGASLNRGIYEAKGDYIVALHNDVELKPGALEQLTAGFEESSRIALAAPLLDTTDYAAQSADQEYQEDVVLTDQVDSSCVMVKNDFPFQFDQAYGLAFFEMEDLCNQITENGYQISVSTKAQAVHHAGSTTKKMGFGLTPQRKWRNRFILHEKWGEPVEYVIPEQGTVADRLERLEPPVDPSNPPGEWLEAVDEYLTDEVRTKILRSDLNKRELLTIVSILLMADSRELLRTLEDRLNNIELPVPMLMLFVNYYFEKNIYSRCRHYLEKAGDAHPAFDLFRLKIYVADKEKKKASGMLAKLLEEYPASPDLFSLAAKLYRQEGNEDEANSFSAMASQLDPVDYPPEEAAFEIKF